MDAKITVVNFAFTLTAAQRAELAKMLGIEESAIVFVESRPGFFKPEEMEDGALPKWQRYINSIVESGKIPREGRIIVNLPGMSWSAVATIAAIAGWIGHLPEIVRSVADEATKEFHVQEIIPLQQLRDESRKLRYTGVSGQNMPNGVDKVVVNFSHPLTDIQLAAIEAVEGKVYVVNVQTQADVTKPFATQATAFVNAAGLSSELWQQTGKVLVNAPAMAPLAVAVFSEINARMGEFPRTIRLNQLPDRTYEFAEIMDIQLVRKDWTEKSIVASQQPVDLFMALLLEAAQLPNEKFNEWLWANWAKHWDTVATEGGLKWEIPGIGNNMFAIWVRTALAVGAITLNEPKKKE